MSVHIREHRPGGDISDFLRAGHRVLGDDPSWVAPLESELKGLLNPKKNPFFAHAEVTLFTAWRDGKLVGRCSAQIDHEHLRCHGDDAGFFGFFETLDDQEAASALIQAAASWVAERGMRVLRGPFNLSINHECGLLVEGFEHPNVVMMPQSRTWQAALAEGAGLTGIKDLLAWRYDVSAELPARATRAWEQIDALPEVKFRSVKRNRMHDELKIVLEIFNDAWRHNWGFVPMTDAEVAKSAADMKLLIDEDMAFFAEVDGRPVAMCVCVPNLNEASRDLKGNITNPLNAIKLLWRLKVSKTRSARLILLGIRTELRGVKRYGALSTALYAELVKRGQAKGYEWAELGWTLEDNQPINLGIRAMRGRVYKRYRLYEMNIEEMNQ